MCQRPLYTSMDLKYGYLPLLRRAVSKAELQVPQRPKLQALLAVVLVALALLQVGHLRLHSHLADHEGETRAAPIRHTADMALGGEAAATGAAQDPARSLLGPASGGSDTEGAGAAAGDTPSAECTPPGANLEAAPLEGCIELTNVCFDQQSVVLYDEKYRPDSPGKSPGEPAPLPPFSLAGLKDNWVPMEETIGDVYEQGSGLLYPELPIRVHSRAEPTDDLRHPVFNQCRVPLVAWYNFMYNYFETYVNLVTRLHMLRADGNLTGQPDLVLGTQWGQALAGYHSALPAPFLARPVTSFAEFSSRERATRPPGSGAPAAAEGPPGRCFARAYLCKWEHATYWDSWNAGQWLHRHYAQAPGPGGEAGERAAEAAWRAGPVLRVAIEDRQSGVRRILNLDALLAACNREGDWRIDGDSPFRSVRCVRLRFTGNMAHNARAVREAHALVGIHGSGLTNAMMMRYGAALVELLPRGFTSCCAPIARFFGAMAHWNLDRLQYWSVSAEDDAAYAPGAYEQRRLAAGAAPVPFDYRDRHVILRWQALKQVLEGVASVGLDPGRYDRERASGWTHVVAAPEAVLPLEQYDPEAAAQLPKNWMPAAAAAA